MGRPVHRQQGAEFLYFEDLLTAATDFIRGWNFLPALAGGEPASAAGFAAALVQHRAQLMATSCLTQRLRG
jgi:hypothetical protein